MTKLIHSTLLALPVTGCAHEDVTLMSTQKITPPKFIALSASRALGVTSVEKQLKAKGFKVLHWSSQKRVSEQVSATKNEQYNESSTRYVLVLDGAAYTDAMNRCFGGGFKFDYLSADLVDTQTDETIVNISGAGYSEDCPPMSGHLFGNIADGVRSAWQ